MGRTLDEMIATLPAVRRERVQQRAQELIREELSLGELRKKLELTQTDVARRLKKGQEVVSRIEQRQDLLLSTLQDYVESLGGELELVCRFQNRESVRLKPMAAKPAAKRVARRRMAVA
jgi:hypothetical protein